VTLSAGGTPIDLNNTVLSIRYQNYYKQIPYGTNTSNGDLLWDYSAVVHVDGDKYDNLLEKNEKYKITINMTAVDERYDDITTLPKTNDYLTIELKPSVGAPLVINKQIPPSIPELTWV